MIAERDSAGNEMASPLMIARRLMLLPFVLLFRCLYVGSVAACWGIEQAKSVWEETR